MDKSFWLLLITSISLAVSAGVLAYAYFKVRKKTKDFGSIWSKGRNAKKTANSRLTIFLQKSYVKSLKVLILKDQVSKIRKRLSSINTYDEFTIRKETMKITFQSLGIILIAILLLAILSRSLSAVFFGVMAAIVLNGLFINIFVNRVEDRLLKQFSQFLEEERHYYQEVRMVEEAIYEAAQGSPHEIKLQTERIHGILTSKEPRKELDKYYAVAPNRYLKIFAGVSNLVMDYGDRMLQKGSMYLNALNKFVQEIRLDLYRRKKLSYKLNGLTIIALAPILLSFPLVRWAETYFPITAEFYQSRTGYIIRLVIFAAAILAYMIIRKIAEIDEAKYVSKGIRNKWEEKVYK
ncbi:hypothetical protein P4K96_22780 [Bacillus cereus]|nr:hypothetical protein [Bacillus cereus]